MATPSTTKTVRVSAETQERLNKLAASLNGTVDDAITWMFAREESMVRVPASPRQLERWQVSATQAGLELADFVQQVTEAAVAYGADRGTMLLVFEHVRETRRLVTQLARIAEQQAPHIP